MSETVSTTMLDPIEITIGDEENLDQDMVQENIDGVDTFPIEESTPLLVVEARNGYVAWAGDESLVAAKAAALETVPCYVVDGSEFERLGVDPFAAAKRSKERKTALLNKIGETQAVDLLSHWLA